MNDSWRAVYLGYSSTEYMCQKFKYLRGENSSLKINIHVPQHTLYDLMGYIFTRYLSSVRGGGVLWNECCGGKV